LTYVGKEGVLFSAMYSLVTLAAEADDVAADVISTLGSVEHMVQVECMSCPAKGAFVVFEGKKL